MAAPAMITRPIPSSGEAMPVIGLGTWQVFDVGGGRAARAAAARGAAGACRAGGRMIDTSPMYGRAEAVTGDLVAELGRGRTSFSRPRCGPAAATRDRADAALGRIAEEPGPRPDPDSQSARLAHPSRDAAADEGAGPGPLYRHHPLHDRLAAGLARILDSEPGIDFVQCGYSLATRDAESRAVSDRRGAQGGGHRQPALRDRRHVPPGAGPAAAANGRPISTAPAGPSSSSNTSSPSRR